MSNTRTLTVTTSTATETRALRMLRDGYSIRQVSEATGVPAPRLVQLVRDFPGASPARPAPPVPAGGRTAAGTTWLRAGDLFVDETYQRDLDLRRVLAMARDYDPALIGVVEVSDRGPAARPRYAIVDGRHRWELLRHVDAAGDEASVLCHVHTGLSPRDEASLFGRIDSTRRRLTLWDRWKARRAAGDPTAVLVERVVSEAGLRLGPSRRPGVVTSPRACEGLLALGGVDGEQLLGATLRTLVAAWGRRDPLEVVGGAGLVRHHYTRAEVPESRLVAALESVTPAQLKARARAMRELQKGQLPVLTASVIVALLNNSRRTVAALPPFGTRASDAARAGEKKPTSENGDLDPVIVERIVAGEPIPPLTAAERAAVVRALSERGWGASAICKRLHMSGGRVRELLDGKSVAKDMRPRSRAEVIRG